MVDTGIEVVYSEQSVGSRLQGELLSPPRTASPIEKHLPSIHPRVYFLVIPVKSLLETEDAIVLRFQRGEA